VAHVKAGILFLATRVNFVSADLDFVSDKRLHRGDVFSPGQKGPVHLLNHDNRCRDGRLGP
jgi:hypothetical protein